MAEVGLYLDGARSVDQCSYSMYLHWVQNAIRKA